MEITTKSEYDIMREKVSQTYNTVKPGNQTAQDQFISVNWTRFIQSLKPWEYRHARSKWKSQAIQK